MASARAEPLSVIGFPCISRTTNVHQFQEKLWDEQTTETNIKSCPGDTLPLCSVKRNMYIRKRQDLYGVCIWLFSEVSLACQQQFGHRSVPTNERIPQRGAAPPVTLVHVRFTPATVQYRNSSIQDKTLVMREVCRDYTLGQHIT